MNRALVDSLRPFLSAARRRPSHAELTELLYQRWFIDWRAPRHLDAQAAGDHRLVAQLSHLAGSGTWLAPDWTVTARAAHRAFVTDGAVQLYVDATQQLVPAEPAVADTVQLRMPCARGCATPGFFLLVSQQGRATAVHDKLYLHLTPAGGRAVIERLSRLDARFEVKVANSAAAYGRRDSGVVYLDPRHRNRLMRALLPLSQRRGLFAASVPPMTKRLARGIAVAQPEPVDAEAPASFGDERCKLVAKALLEATPMTLTQQLERSLREAGINPREPWRRSSKG